MKAAFGRLYPTSALGNYGQCNYTTAEAGLWGFTKTLTLGLAHFLITANCIVRGFVVSDFDHGQGQADQEELGRLRRRPAKAFRSHRSGRVQDIDHAVSFFVGEGAGFVFGQVVCVSSSPMP